MYAAQYFATIRKLNSDIDRQIESGNLAPIFDWLNENIWSKASELSTDELVTRATGEALNPKHFRAHLEARYLG
jgi:carboxypeptidase Taq